MRTKFAESYHKFKATDDKIRAGIARRERASAAVAMHHRKGANANGGAGKGMTKKDSTNDAMSKLRYLNKKPLCLQYAISNPSTTRKHHYSSSKRKEPSFIMIILIGLCKLIYWMVVSAQRSLLDFLLKPAEELFPREYDCNQSYPNATYPTLAIRRPRRCGVMKRDFGRTARMFAIQDRQAAMCYF